MKKRMTELIKNAPVGTSKHKLSYFLSPDSMEQISEYLISNGVLAPPVKIGGSVFAAIEYGEEPCVDEYEVKGIEWDGEKFWVINIDGEDFEIGDALCKLTHEEAEQSLSEDKQCT